MSHRIQKTISPIDGSILVERPLATNDELAKVLEQAAAAQKHWKRVPLPERAATCRRMADYCVDHADRIGEEITRQMGRPIAYSPFEIRRGFHERATYMANIAEAALADIAIESKDGFERYIRREPLGVVFVVAPWNYPWLTSVNAIVPALLAGNTVVLKMAQQTPLVAERYAQAFKAAGLPDGVFHFVHLDHEQVGRAIRDRRVAYVAFTGSVGGGHAVQQAASERFIGAGLELGGKDPAYVRADAPLAATVENLVDGAFFNSGQSCCGVERIYVHRDVYDPFVEAFVELTKQYRLGNPLNPQTTLGPMVRTDAADTVRAQIRQALAVGATALIDPSDFPTAQDGTPYLAPQVLVDVDHRMRIMSEETFGPVVGIMRVDGDDDAIRFMNDSRYGLTASVWTQDLDAAKRIGDEVETGTLYMNRCDYLDPALAWTGVKDSGRGCTLSRLGLETFTRPKSFHLRVGA
ncbi:MAG TPA: aldehyde dehydrogenase family protein [Burkholderiales bacterium]|nr:aldehyde dehydrogenase family protein [Burkholderiales bacterium]